MAIENIEDPGPWCECSNVYCEQEEKGCLLADKKCRVDPMGMNLVDPAIEEIELAAPESRFKSLTVFKNRMIAIDEDGQVYASRRDLDYIVSQGYTVEMKRLKIEITD